MAAREAMLKREYAGWYPRIVPGVWYRAAWMAEEVLDQQRRGEPRWAFKGRALSEAHFLFRGGPAPRTSQHTRREDTRGPARETGASEQEQPRPGSDGQHTPT